MNEAVISFVMITIGVVAIIGAALDWRIVSHSGMLLNRIFGDTVARAIYAAVGLVFVILGVFRYLGF